MKKLFAACIVLCLACGCELDKVNTNALSVMLPVIDSTVNVVAQPIRRHPSRVVKIFLGGPRCNPDFVDCE